MTKYTLLLILLSTLFSCRKEVDWPINAIENSNPVVQAMLTNETKSHEFILQYSVSNLNETPKAFSGATIKLFDGDSVYLFNESLSEPGHYNSKPNLAGIPGHQYQLTIFANGKEYTAEYTMTYGKIFSPIKYSQLNNSGWYSITDLPEIYNANDYAYYEIEIDWSHLSGFDTLPFNKTHASIKTYTLPSIDVNEILPVGLEDVQFPKGSIISTRRYSLSYEHALFYRALLIETSWNGGFFDTRSGNVIGNFNNDAMGYFSACSVVTTKDTVN